MSFNPFKAHHLYWGAGLIILGVLVKPIGIPCYVLGGLLMLDDIIQHAADCPSPVNLFFKWAWRKIFGNWWPFGNL